MNDEELSELFGEMREEPVPVDSLVRTRMRVDQGIRRKTDWTFAAWAAVCAALLLAVLFVPSRETRTSVPVPKTVAHRKAPQPQIETPAPVSVEPAIRRQHRVRKTSPPPQTVAIRIETPDPDVVIVLVSNDRPERNQN